MPHASATHGVHAGREDLSTLGVHALPLDFSTTYPLPNLEEGRDDLLHMALGGTPKSSPVYARLHNPTVARFEAAMATLEGGDAGVAFSTGMAAITACLLAAQQEGGHVIALRPLYGGSDHLLNSGMFKLDVSWATPETLADHIRPDTALIMVETPANPTLKLVDIRAITDIAGDVPVLVDSTFATPVLQNPIAQGATLVLHSATKYLGGHGDVMGGVVVANEAWSQRLRQVRVATGALLHPMGAYLLHRGLQTLHVRILEAQRSAQHLVQKLRAHPAIHAVYYPGLRDCDPHALVGRQMKGAGTMVAFEVKGGFQSASRVIQGVQLMTAAVSLGSTDTLIQHPAALTHQVVDERVREDIGITPSLMRISVGLEAPEDLWADLAEVLDAIQAQFRSRDIPFQANPGLTESVRELR